ncbi:MAG: SRPBCC domain-containing protein [Flavobacteriales bacterium TMED288]|nr:hypothetical protein [Flavobacteriales bacterium]RPG52762.1 MAG: SRPBCC domain-containing protein [Flavobacteriales bacterium TMED288]|tara:strand:+ start:2128 stop:2511 length:384 start_codon:yes stop_codon:yes gene_type:complete
MNSKIKYELEFPIKSSVRILFNQISTPSGLSEWFSNDVNIKSNIFTFIWDNDSQDAELLNKKNNQSIRFKWLDEPKNTYFEFNIIVDEITLDTSLIVIDFADDEEDMEEAKLLWEKQIEKLRQSIGS